MTKQSRHQHRNQPTLSGAPSETGQGEPVAHSTAEKTERVSQKNTRKSSLVSGMVMLRQKQENTRRNLKDF